MSQAEITKLKMELLSWLESVGDEEILAELSCIKERATALAGIETLSSHQRDRILKGISQVERGETVSSDELWTQLVARRSKNR